MLTSISAKNPAMAKYHVLACQVIFLCLLFYYLERELVRGIMLWSAMDYRMLIPPLKSSKTAFEL